MVVRGGEYLGRAVVQPARDVVTRSFQKERVRVRKYKKNDLVKTTFYHVPAFSISSHRSDVLKPAVEQQFFGPFKQGVNLYSVGNIKGHDIYVGDLNGERLIFNVKKDSCGNALYDSDKNLQIRVINRRKVQGSLEEAVFDIYSKLHTKQQEKLNSLLKLDVYKASYDYVSDVKAA